MKQNRTMLHGWGRYPRMEARLSAPANVEELRFLLGDDPAASWIVRGSGLSYGDSSLAADVIDGGGLRQSWELDEKAGLLRVSAGFSLREILSEIVPRGWFLPVLPGTAQASLGGAIAADVHGKNHHRDGSFCEHLGYLQLMLADGGIETCSPAEQPELFRASCGGMGLTGVILEAELQLARISSASMLSASLTAANLGQCFDLLEEHDSAHYSVAWLDCLAHGTSMGRGTVFLAEHATDGELDDRSRKLMGVPSTPPSTFMGVPFVMPGMLLNRYSLAGFNSSYFHWQRLRAGSRLQGHDTCFFPLDRIRNWNLLYGRAGFLQYQFVLPADAARDGIRLVLKRVSDAGKGSFLSVLKKMGPANGNLLSFPADGYTLALDFKREASLFPLLDELDAMVLDHGGHIYLAKDARMRETVFKAGYPDWERFLSVKQQVDPNMRFRSAQSDRIGLTGPGA